MEKIIFVKPENETKDPLLPFERDHVVFFLKKMAKHARQYNRAIGYRLESPSRGLPVGADDFRRSIRYLFDSLSNNLEEEAERLQTPDYNEEQIEREMNGLI